MRLADFDQTPTSCGMLYIVCCHTYSELINKSADPIPTFLLNIVNPKDVT